MQRTTLEMTSDANRPTRTLRSSRVWTAAFLMVILASCERVPSKSDYVSARVTVLCADKVSEELQACRLAVIGQFANTPLEELQRRFPAPEPRSRPSCSF